MESICPHRARHSFSQQKYYGLVKDSIVERMESIKQQAIRC